LAHRSSSLYPGPPPPSPPLPPPLSPSHMSFTSDNPPFLPFDGDQSLPRSRQLSASSIWAPQPQPSEATWPKAFDSFSRVVDHPDLRHSTSFPITREDVFGPVGFQDGPRKRDVGAIGEGRKKASPEFENNVCPSRETKWIYAETRFILFYLLACRAASSCS